ncbi:MAG: Wzz/FepE/Etk N-terminal domain-containing protein, partial [Acidobacteriota bacterium]|nr:Wzz/FepE/Etk N-terminal domain-containing protein [Acidobacteriota bacterium]
MMSQDNRLLPLTSTSLDRPLGDIAQSKKYYGVSADESARLRDYVGVILKRKWLILSLVVVVTSLVTIQMYRLPPIYEAQTTIQIEQKKSIIQTKDQVLNLGNDATYWNTQLKLLENPQLVRQVVLALNLQDNPAFSEGQASSFLGSIKRIFFGDKPAPAHADYSVPVIKEGGLNEEHLTQEQLERLEPYEDAVRANLTVEPLERTSLVNISYRHSNPEIAMKVANTLAQVFILNDIKHTTKGEMTFSEELARQIAELQLSIQQDSERLKNYKHLHDLPIGATPAENPTLTRLNDYSGKLIAAEDARKKAQSAYEAAKNSTDPWSVPEIQDDKSIQRLREKISDLEEKRSALLRTYTEEWPGVKTIDDQIKQVKSDLDRRPTEIITSLKLRYESALATEQKTRTDYERERAASQRQGEAAIDIDSLTREIESNKQLYQTLIQKQNELKLTSSENSANNVTVATPARMPRAP